MRFKELVIAVGCMLAACGDDDAKDPSASLNDKKVSELQGAELLDLCQWVINLDDKSVSSKQICTADAVDYTDTKAECEEERDLCIEDFDEDERDDDDSCTDFSIDKSCNVDVAKFKSCFKALLSAYSKAAREASCDDLSGGTVVAPAACDGLPSACVAFEASATSSSPALLPR